MKDTTILLIDNNFQDIENFIKIFKEENFCVLVAVTIKKAKKILSYIIPELIVSEVDIEDGGGYDILNYIKSHDKYANTSFIFLSKETTPKQKNKALSHGIEGYFTKPFLTEELKIRIQRIIKKFTVKRFDIDKKIFSSTDNLSLVEIIQLLEKTQKSGIFTIFTGHKIGAFYFKDGNIISGRFGDITGKKAVYKMLEVEDAIYEFEFRDMDYEVEIQQLTRSLILEGIKRIDESGIRKKVSKKKLPVKYEIFCIGFHKNQIMHLFDENEYNVIIYKDPRDALGMLDKISPDLVIITPEMPGINGFKFLRILKNSTITYHLPVVFVTTEKSEEEKIIALKEGAADYFFPPITKFEFDSRIKKIIAENELKKKEYSDTLKGSLNNFSVFDVIQGIQATEKTCMVTFHNGDDSCNLFFKKGELINAMIEHQEGEEAVCKILMWSKGFFEVRFKDYKVPSKIKTSTFNLILDGLSKCMITEEKEVEESIKKAPKKREKEPATDTMVNVGFYNFILEIAKLDLGENLIFSTIKIGTLNKFLQIGGVSNVFFVDLNLVGKEALEELALSKKAIYEKVQNGLNIVCFTSRPEIYDFRGVLNKFSWLADYDDTKKIKESLSDHIMIKTNVDFFEFNEIKDSMYYTAAFPHGFGSPGFRPILFSSDGIPVALYRKIGKGFVFLIPQPQSKEEFVNFFIKKILPKIKKNGKV